MEKAKRLLKGRELGSDIMERRRFKQVSSPEDVIREVAKAFRVDEEMLKERIMAMIDDKELAKHVEKLKSYFKD